MYGEGCFSQKYIPKCTNYGFATTSLSQKTAQLSSKKKVPGPAVIHEGHADSLL